VYHKRKFPPMVTDVPFPRARLLARVMHVLIKTHDIFFANQTFNILIRRNLDEKTI